MAVITIFRRKDHTVFHGIEVVFVKVAEGLEELYRIHALGITNNTVHVGLKRRVFFEEKL